MIKIINKVYFFSKKALNYLRPVFLVDDLKPESSSCQRWLHLFVTTCSGFIFIAFILFILSLASPTAYKLLTKWANQPPMPTIKRCTLKMIPNEQWDIGALFKNVRKYRLTFELDTTLGDSAYGISYIEDSRLSIKDIKSKDFPKYDDPAYVVFQKRDFSKNPPELFVYFNATEGELDKLDYTRDECPVNFSFFGDRK
jgi:hypothetical protein